MKPIVEYFLVPQSPWAYLGHRRFVDIANAFGAAVEVLPFDLGGKVFPISGGLPLSQRAPQRQAYRLLEMRRFAERLALPLNLHPKYFPVAGDAASKLILAVATQHGSAAALRFSGAVLAAVWAEERDIADAATLAELLRESGLPASSWAQSQSAATQQAYDAATQRAIGAGVFGAPSYVIDGELFWGQDRLDFVERRLQELAGG